MQSRTDWPYADPAVPEMQKPLSVEEYAENLAGRPYEDLCAHVADQAVKLRELQILVLLMRERDSEQRKLIDLLMEQIRAQDDTVRLLAARIDNRIAAMPEIMQ